jgi:hypothetical protein
MTQEGLGHIRGFRVNRVSDTFDNGPAAATSITVVAVASFWRGARFAL